MKSVGNSPVSPRGCMDNLHLGNMLGVAFWQSENLGAKPVGVFSGDVEEA